SCAVPVAVRHDLVALDAAPVRDRIPTARRHLEKIRPVSLVEAQRGLCERGRRSVHFGEVSPERIRLTIRPSALEGGLDPFELLHASTSPVWSVRGRRPPV